jgi:beta-phosphoglucomutase-like phosphatase (HAD superfamily)
VALKAAAHPWLEPIRTRVHGDDPELKAGKPAPDVFLLAAERLGVRPSQCWAFEDSLAGARSAVAAGCQVMVVLAADLHPQDYPPQARCLRSLRELPLDDLE